MSMTRWTTGLAALCLALFLSACAGTPEVVTRTEVRPVIPPAALMAPCPRPDMEGQTNAALLDWALALDEALEHCNADKRALRRWADEHQEEPD